MMSSISHFVPVFFFALVLFQRIAEVVHSNKNSAKKSWGLIELQHVGWIVVLFFGAFIFESSHNFWFLLLYLVVQAIRLYDLGKEKTKWTLLSKLTTRSGVLWFAAVAEGFALPLAFGLVQLGFVVGLLNLVFRIYLFRKATLVH